METFERYELIRESFREKLVYRDNKILLNEVPIGTVNNQIPDFTNNKLDDFTKKMFSFYDEIKFPNYDDFEDYASLYEKGIRNLFSRRLDYEIDNNSRILELGCTGQLFIFSKRKKKFMELIFLMVPL